MSPEVEHLFVNVRRLHVVFLVAVGVIAITAVRIEMAETGTPLLEDRPPLLWALRVGLATLGAIGFVMVERVVRQSSKPERSLVFRDLPTLSQELGRDAILRMMFFEAVAVYGLLLVLVGGSWLDTACFACAAVVLLLWRFPRRSAWVAALNAESLPSASRADGP